MSKTRDFSKLAMAIRQVGEEAPPAPVPIGQDDSRVVHVAITSGPSEMAPVSETDDVLAFEPLVIEVPLVELVEEDIPQYQIEDILSYANFDLRKARDVLLSFGATDEDYWTLAECWLSSWRAHLRAVLGNQGNADTLGGRYKIAQSLIHRSGTPEMWMGKLRDLLYEEHQVCLQAEYEAERRNVALRQGGDAAAIEAELNGDVQDEEAA